MEAVVAFHGTHESQTVARILLKGFKSGTYFAYKIEDAIRFGGPYIFVVKFSSEQGRWQGESDGWQFHLRDPLPAENIVVSFSLVEFEAV